MDKKGSVAINSFKTRRYSDVQTGKLKIEETDLREYMHLLSTSRSNLFDAIILFHVLHYLTPIEEEQLLLNCFRTLKPSGRLYISAFTIYAYPYYIPQPPEYYTSAFATRRVTNSIEDYVQTQKRLRRPYPSYLNPKEIGTHKWRRGIHEFDCFHPQDGEFLSELLKNMHFYIYGITNFSMDKTATELHDAVSVIVIK